MEVDQACDESIYFVKWVRFFSVSINFGVIFPVDSSIFFGLFTTGFTSCFGACFLLLTNKRETVFNIVTPRHCGALVALGSRGMFDEDAF